MGVRRIAAYEGEKLERTWRKALQEDRRCAQVKNKKTEADMHKMYLRAANEPTRLDDSVQEQNSQKT